MPATTEAIAMATLEQVRKLFPSAENLQVGQGDICIVYFIGTMMDIPDLT